KGWRAVDGRPFQLTDRMCGIAGYSGPRPLAPERITACEMLMRHRGPDGHGRYSHEVDGRHVLLLHSRLAIIDLDPRSDQPFRDGPQVMVFNGELYDYVEQRKALEARGEVFRTESDTEVLGRLMRLGGADALGQCEGMWAVAAYEEVKGTLLLTRD